MKYSYTTNVVIQALLILVVSSPKALAAEDMLSLDYTIFVQMAIFISAIFIFNSLLFKPMLSLIERREQLTKGTVKEAAELEAKAKSMVEEYESKMNLAREEALEERESLRSKTHTEAYDIVHHAREEVQSLIEDARQKLEAETLETKERVKPQVEIIARAISSRILGREV